MLYPQILGFCGGDESPGPTKWIELTQCDYDGKLQLQVRPCLITPALRDSHPHYANEYQLANPKEAHVAILELLRGSFGSFVDKTIETSDEITKGVFTVAATIARGQPVGQSRPECRSNLYHTNILTNSRRRNHFSPMSCVFVELAV